MTAVAIASQLGSHPQLRLIETPPGKGEGFLRALPRLLLWKRDLAAMLGRGGRTLERMISRGEIPPPDRRLRGRPAWLPATIEGWIERGCPSLRA